MGDPMQNKDFKRIWEKKGRQLFAIQQQKTADDHKLAMKQRKGMKKVIPQVAPPVKHGQKRKNPKQLNRVDFHDLRE